MNKEELDKIATIIYGHAGIGDRDMEFLKDHYKLLKSGNLFYTDIDHNFGRDERILDLVVDNQPISDVFTITIQQSHKEAQKRLKIYRIY